MKWMLALTIAAVLVVVLATVFVVSLDVEQYRDEFITYVEDVTGREFSIDGEFGLKLSFVPTLRVGGVRLANSERADDADLLAVDRIEARLALWPLLRAEVRLRHLALEGVQLNLATDRRGRGNWMIETAAAAEMPARGWQPDFDLESVTVSGLHVRYRPHGAAGRELDVGSLRLRERGIGEPLDIDVDASFAGLPVAARGHSSRIKHLLRDEPFEFALAGTLGDAGFTLGGATEAPSRAFAQTLEFSFEATDPARLAAALVPGLTIAAPVTITGTMTRGDGDYRLHPFEFAAGASMIRGDLTIVASQRPQIRGEVELPRFVLSDFWPAPTQTPAGVRLFSASPLPFAELDDVDADIAFSADTVETAYAHFTHLGGRLELDDGRLRLDGIKANAAGGAFTATFEAETDDDATRSKLDVSLRNARLDQLPPLAAQGHVTGGPFDLSVELTGRGNSVQSIMAAADGRLALDIGPGVIRNDAASIAERDLVWSLFSRLNPLASNDPVTRMECAAIRFSIDDGVAANPRGIALLTKNLSVLGGGTVDLATERIDIGARPKPREGVGLSVSGLVDFVRLGGTLKQPRAVTSNAGIATAGAKVGAAVATAGLSVVAEGLFDRATADANVCAVVRESLSSPAGGESVIESTTSKTKAVVRDAGKAIKNAFESLFGD